MENLADLMSAQADDALLEVLHEFGRLESAWECLFHAMEAGDEDRKEELSLRVIELWDRGGDVCEGAEIDAVIAGLGYKCPIEAEEVPMSGHDDIFERIAYYAGEEMNGWYTDACDWIEAIVVELKARGYAVNLVPGGGSYDYEAVRPEAA